MESRGNNNGADLYSSWDVKATGFCIFGEVNDVTTDGSFGGGGWLTGIEYVSDEVRSLDPLF